MILFILYITFLISGIIYEAQVLTYKDSNKTIKLAYTIGSFFFLFYEEAYIIHGFIILLLTLGVIKDSLEKSSEISYLKGVLHFRDLNDEEGIRQEENKNMTRMARITKCDAILSLITLLLLTFHASIWLATLITDILN